jgi:two-component system sensor histidine kinase SenX3
VTAVLAVACVALAVATVALAVRSSRLARVAARVPTLERDRSEARRRAARADDVTTGLRQALDAIPEGVVIAAADGSILARNHAATEVATARHGDALVGSAVDDLLAAAVRGDAGQQTLDLFGPPQRVVNVSAHPLPSGALVVIEDITESRRLDAVRRDFVANLSHELKTPVGAIGLLAETLLSEPDGDVARRLTERVVNESFRVSRTIDDLLELSRIEAGAEIVREPVPVHLLLEEAAERVRPGAERRDIEVRVSPITPRATAVGDRRQLVSAVANLLENAVKYSPPSSLVEVRAQSDGTRVSIEVEDHGIGIPAREVERIFERFYRVDRARSRDTGGTGLGLSIVRHIVANHGGEVSVTSVEGQGSTFTLAVPAGPGPVGVSEPVAPRRSA